MPQNPAERPSLSSLRDLFLREKTYPKVNGVLPGEMEWPNVEPPAIFKPEPPVIGSPRLARSVKEIYRTVPELRHADVKQINAGPTPGVAETLREYKFPVGMFDKTNLLGMYDRRDKQVFVRPNIDLGTELNTIAHELTHGMGEEEIMSDAVGSATEEVFQQKANKDVDTLIQEITQSLKAKGMWQEPNKNAR